MIFYMEVWWLFFSYTCYCCQPKATGSQKQKKQYIQCIQKQAFILLVFSSENASSRCTGMSNLSISDHPYFSCLCSCKMRFKAVLDKAALLECHLLHH